MAPLKALGDGMPLILFQYYWQHIGYYVAKVVLSCLNSGKIPFDLNYTYLTLIPKVKSPKRVTKFHPIAHCNVLYKLISKVLANRLKKILPHIISNTQSVFPSNKEILDNILVAFESLHHLKSKKSRKKGFLAIKLDMSKSYDRVEWVYILKLMEKMGFTRKWIQLISECISTISYSILVNGEPSGVIKPSRGIKQGNPFPPYLFFLCSKGLTQLIKKAVQVDKIIGYSLFRNGPKISQLFFVDDNLLFCGVQLGDIQTIQAVLDIYEKASGQQINKEKTNLFFSKLVSFDDKNAIKNMLGVSEIKEYEKYLGLPTVIGKNKRANFNYIKEMVWGKL